MGVSLLYIYIIDGKENEQKSEYLAYNCKLQGWCKLYVLVFYAWFHHTKRKLGAVLNDPHNRMGHPLEYMCIHLIGTSWFHAKEVLPDHNLNIFLKSSILI